jgi:hypothetical protein
MVGGGFHFSVTGPHVVYLAFQDYSGAVTTNSGQTWEYMNVTGHSWGGMSYGGYAINATAYVAGAAGSWTGPRHVMTSHDAGRSWTNHTVAFEGHDVSFGDPSNPAVVFASNWRSQDGGVNWRNMSDCAGVVTNTTWRGSSVLLGIGRGSTSVVLSQDGGMSWQTVVTLPELEITDIAAGPELQPLLVVGSDRLLACHQSEGNSTWNCTEPTTPLDQYNSTGFRSVAVDPSQPAIAYVSSARNMYASNRPVLRTTDAGQTWSSLLIETPLNDTELQGVHEASWLRVHPTSGVLWVAGGCFGVWTWSE